MQQVASGLIERAGLDPYLMDCAVCCTSTFGSVTTAAPVGLVYVPTPVLYCDVGPLGTRDPPTHCRIGHL